MLRVVCEKPPQGNTGREGAASRGVGGQTGYFHFFF